MLRLGREPGEGLARCPLGDFVCNTCCLTLLFTKPRFTGEETEAHRAPEPHTLLSSEQARLGAGPGVPGVAWARGRA